MSQLVDLYNSSQKLRPTQAREIPDRAVDFFDRNKDFASGFTTKLSRGAGNAEQFTDRALKYYDEELANMVIPESFVRHEGNIPLNRYNPVNKYYVPGRSPGETDIGTGNR